MRELDVELIRARSPQAKGRIERSFGAAQDRWVKELRLAGATTLDEANAVLERLLPEHNRQFAKPARQSGDGRRPLGTGHVLASILSIQEEQVAANDYTIRFHNRFYQLLKPVHSGERGGKVVIELRLDGSMAVRFRGKYLKYREALATVETGGSAPRPPEFNALAADASGENTEGSAPEKGAEAAGVPPTGGRSGRTPAEPYPPDGAAKNNSGKSRRPAENHPWRSSFKKAN